MECRTKSNPDRKADFLFLRQKAGIIKTAIEILIIRAEIRHGRVLAAIAESADNVRDAARGKDARMLGRAAYNRASHLLAQVAESEREPLVRDLEHLKNALDDLSENEQFGKDICNKARPEEPTTLPLFAASFPPEIFSLSPIWPAIATGGSGTCHYASL